MRGALAAVAMAVVGCAGRGAGLAEYRGQLAGEGPLEIVQLDLDRPDPESVLRKQAAAVDSLDPEMPQLVARMSATLEKSGGVGLAAPQVGVSRRVLLVRHGTRPKGQPVHVEAYVNPEVSWASAQTEEDYEACLSVSRGGGLVPRAKAVRIRYQRPGEAGWHELDLTDWDARIMQHELDHLDGKMFVDRLVGELMSMEEMRKRRDEKHRAMGWLPPAP